MRISDWSSGRVLFRSLPVTPSQARGDERRSGGKPPKSLSPSNVELPACLEGFPKQAENLHGMVFRSFPARAGEIGDQIGALRGIGQAREHHLVARHAGGRLGQASVQRLGVPADTGFLHRGGLDRKSVVYGKSLAFRVDLWGRRHFKNK